MSLQITDLVFSYADRRVLDGVSLSVIPGATVGLVGENGSGKSTLLQIAAGLLEADGGSVQLPNDVGYFSQDSGLDPTATLAQVMYDALAPLHQGIERMEELAGQLDASPERADEYARLLEWAMVHDAWDAERRAEAVSYTHLTLPTSDLV